MATKTTEHPHEIWKKIVAILNKEQKDQWPAICEMAKIAIKNCEND